MIIPQQQQQPNASQQANALLLKNQALIRQVAQRANLGMNTGQAISTAGTDGATTLAGTTAARQAALH